jgi:sensor histidine kinase YesM
MDGESLDKINRGIDQNKPFSNIGVINIRKRIKLQFGDTTDLVYTSEIGAGTVAKLNFPLKT